MDDRVNDWPDRCQYSLQLHAVSMHASGLPDVPCWSSYSAVDKATLLALDQA